MLLYNETVYCVDSICFHAGGPLGSGIIRDIEDEPCLECPWHRLCISLVDGRKFSRPVKIDPITKRPKACGWKKSGSPFQRVHGVRVVEDEVFVHLSLEGQVDSDYYAERADIEVRSDDFQIHSSRR